MASVWGKNLKLSLFGESHGDGVGIVIDGFPAGMRLDETLISDCLRRRAPGGRYATPRAEADLPHLRSGVREGVTTGAPICVFIENTAQRSGDYAFASGGGIPRPSHADYPATVKYGGFSDLRGGGHFSGRLTAPLVFAGALAQTAIAEKGIKVGAQLLSVGGETGEAFDPLGTDAETLSRLRCEDLPTLSPDAAGRFAAEISAARSAGDSVGGVIEGAVLGLPVGLGAHPFESLEGRFASLAFGIPGVKGVEFGLGFELTRRRGSAVNDGYEMRDGRVTLASNNGGGAAGGMTTGAPFLFRLAMKPTPSIATPQCSVDLGRGENASLSVGGRHDPCIALRAIPVAEAVAALTVLDLLLDAPALLSDL